MWRKIQDSWWTPAIITILLTLAILSDVEIAPVESRYAAPHQQDEISEDVALIDLSRDGGPASLRIPKKPGPWQKGPPCMRGEHAINGACYQRYTREDMSPPCDPGIYEHDGQCWRAIRRATREPSSIQR